MASLYLLLCTFLFITNDAVVSANIADHMIHDLQESTERVKEGVQDTIHDAGEFIHHEVDVLLKNSALAGNVWPVVKKLVITPQKAKLIASKTAEVVHWQDLALIVFLGWFTVPLLKYSTESVAVKSRGGFPTKQNFYDSVPYHVANALSQIAKLALLVYGVDGPHPRCTGTSKSGGSIVGCCHIGNHDNDHL